MKKHVKNALGIVLAGCMLFCMLLPAAATAEEYPYHQLSARDMRAVQNAYSESLRYNFEQWVLPDFVFNEGGRFLQGIYEREDRAREYPYAIWNYEVLGTIVGIQMDSEDVYVLPDWQNDETYIDKYVALAQEAGVEAGDHFDTSFETLHEGSVLLLLSFGKADTTLACKYIGIVAKEDGTARYLTAETNDMADETHPEHGTAVFFCEVTPGGRGNMGLIGNEKQDFIDAVNGLLQ